MHGFLHEMRKCCIFRCAENPRIEIEYEFDMGFCFGIRLAPYVVFSTRIYLQHIARPVESYRPINIVFVRPSVRSSVVGPLLYNRLGQIDAILNISK